MILVQRSTGSVTDIFFSLPACIYCGRIRIFLFPFYRYSSPFPFFPGFVKLLLLFNGHSKLNCVQNLNVKLSQCSFSYKRVTDPRVFLTGGASLDVSFTFDPTGSDTRLQIFTFILILVNLPFKQMAGSLQFW
jgi:hypothetical protein